MLNYSLDSYLSRAEMHDRACLVVEGDSDEYFYGLLLRHVGDVIDVHSVDRLRLIDLDAKAVWEKVELVGHHAAACGSTRVFALSDRMFRLFDIDSAGIRDVQTSPLQHSHLAWTFGHSIENYLFYPALFRAVLQPIVGEVDHMAIALLEERFGDILRVAGELTIAIRQTSQQTPGVRLTEDISKRIGWHWFSMSGEQITLDVNEVERTLTEHRRPYATAFRTAIVENRSAVQATPMGVIRAFCHSHLTECVMWNAFAFCVFQKTEGPPEVKRKALDGIYTSGLDVRRRQLMEALVHLEKEVVNKIIHSINQLVKQTPLQQVAAT